MSIFEIVVGFIVALHVLFFTSWIFYSLILVIIEESDKIEKEKIDTWGEDDARSDR